MRSAARARILTTACLAMLAASVEPAHAAWLDEPPKLYTFRLDDPTSWSDARLPLLAAFEDASVEPSSGLRHYLAGQWGRWRAQPWWPLVFHGGVRFGGAASSPTLQPPPEAWPDGTDGSGVSAGAEPALLAAGEEALFGFEPPASTPELSLAPASTPAWPLRSFITPFIKTPSAIFASNGLDALWSLPPSKPIPNWRCRRRPVRMARYGGETDAFLLVRCDGSVAPQAFDRLTLMARETSAPRPGELLPDEPDADALARGEWTPGVRLVHPRLLWAIQRVADAFPWRMIYVFSGYRHDPSGALPKPGTHHSMHSEARAMDIYVMGIPNASLFQLCRSLTDVGCGYYPNNKFVHVDVRRPGSGHPFWIDESAPGEPSHYVDAWPGVVDSGGLVWDPPGRRDGAASSPKPRATVEP